MLWLKNKLGASYNVFDTEELLEASIRAVREQIDYINIVYQRTSNSGQNCSEKLLPTLNYLLELGLIDELIEFTPDLSVSSHFNELEKRNIGLLNSRKNKCTHFISLDADEFYKEDQFAKAKSYVYENKIKSSCVTLVNYFKAPIYQMQYSGSSEYYVSFIFKISRKTKFEFNTDFPVLIDPTRRIKSKKSHLFSPSEIKMHHMTLVRRNIRSKIENSSANSIYKKNNIDKYVSYFNNWSFGESVYPPSNYDNIVELNIVPNFFDIKID
jgi:hypothetical protein